MGKYMILYRDDRTFLLQQGETYTVYDAGTGEPGAVFMLDSPPRDIIDSDGNLAMKADYDILYLPVRAFTGFAASGVADPEYDRASGHKGKHDGQKYRKDICPHNAGDKAKEHRRKHNAEI